MTNTRGRILKMRFKEDKLYTKEWLRTSPMNFPVSATSNPFDA